MKKLSQSLTTIVIIFGAAYVLSASGCADSSTSQGSKLKDTTDIGNQNGNVNNPETDLQPVKPEDVRECSNNEFAQLISWRNLIDKANSAIVTAQGKQLPAAVEASLNAIKACDSRFAYHRSQPCKKTTKNVVQQKPVIKVYDAFLIHRDCSKVEGYLNKHNLRPEPSVDTTPAPLPIEPSEPTQPLPPVVNDNNNSGLVTCSDDEFARLKDWSGLLDRANASIKKLGSQANWKYDEMAISNSGAATKSCESLMKYHDQRACQKNIKQADGSIVNKSYTKETLGERCKMARTYFYEYVQNSETLIWPNVDLYVDLSRFKQQRFEAQSFITLEGCVAENRTDSMIDYSNRKALITETRGFADKQPLFVTAEGLQIVCYGVDLDGPFSKTQVEKLLKSEGTDLRLEYRLK